MSETLYKSRLSPRCWVMLAISEVDCSCDFVCSMLFTSHSCSSAVNLLEMSCTYKLTKETRGQEEVRGLYCLLVGLGKLRNWKPFFKSWVTLEGLWLSLGCRTTGGNSGGSGYIGFCQQRALWAKHALCKPALLSRVKFTRQAQDNTQ